MRKPDNPCLNCTKRTAECHTKCKFYKWYKTEWELYDEFIKLQKESNEQRVEYTHTRRRAMK